MLQNKFPTLICAAAFVCALHGHGESPAYFGWASRGGGEADDAPRGVAVDREGNIYVIGYTASTNADFGTAIISNPPAMFLAKYNATGNLAWIRQATGSVQVLPLSVAVDAIGNPYVTGSFQSNATFGAQNLNAVGSDDIFVAKYDSNGNTLWAISAGGLGSDRGYGIVVDTATNIYVTGGFQGTANFGSTGLVANGSGDIFVARLNSSGNFVWTQRAGGPSGNLETGNGVGTDSLGNVYVCGSFYGVASFGPTNLTGTDQASLFIAKYSSSGDVIWARKCGGSADCYGTTYGAALAMDAGNNVLVAGRFRECAMFGNTRLEAGWWGDFFYSFDAFLLKLDSDGNFLWVFGSGEWYPDEASGLAIDSAGNSFLSGIFEYELNLGNTTLSNSGLTDVFVAKFNQAGEVLWAVGAGGGGNDRPWGMALDANNRIFVPGRFEGTARFGNTPLTSRGGLDMFVSRLDPPPKLWVARTGADLVLSWPTNASGFIPETRTSLATTNGWMVLTNTPAVIADQYVLTNELVGPGRLFRLRKP